jgi:hypothetical protein
LDSIDPDDPNAKQLAIDLLDQGVLDSRGAALVEEKPSKPQGGGTTATNVIKSRLVDTVEAMQLLENEENSSVPGPIQLKEFELGPTSDPGSLKVTWDPKRKEWTYLNAAFGESKSFKTLKEVMISHPSLFYK